MVEEEARLQGLRAVHGGRAEVLLDLVGVEQLLDVLPCLEAPVGLLPVEVHPVRLQHNGAVQQLRRRRLPYLLRRLAAHFLRKVRRVLEMAQRLVHVQEVPVRVALRHGLLVVPDHPPVVLEARGEARIAGLFQRGARIFPAGPFQRHDVAEPLLLQLVQVRELHEALVRYDERPLQPHFRQHVHEGGDVAHASRVLLVEHGAQPVVPQGDRVHEIQLRGVAAVAVVAPLRVVDALRVADDGGSVEDGVPVLRRDELLHEGDHGFPPVPEPRHEVADVLRAQMQAGDGLRQIGHAVGVLDVGHGAGADAAQHGACVHPVPLVGEVLPQELEDVL